MQAAAPVRLSALAPLLRRGPPSLRAMLERLSGADDLLWFRDMVSSVLPAAEAEEVMAAPTIADKIGTFGYRFELRYFPLNPLYIEFYIEDIGDEPPFR